MKRVAGMSRTALGHFPRRQVGAPLKPTRDVVGAPAMISPAVRWGLH